MDGDCDVKVWIDWEWMRIEVSGDGDRRVVVFSEAFMERLRGCAQRTTMVVLSKVLKSLGAMGMMVDDVVQLDELSRWYGLERGEDGEWDWGKVAWGDDRDLTVWWFMDGGLGMAGVGKVLGLLDRVVREMEKGL